MGVGVGVWTGVGGELFNYSSHSSAKIFTARLEIHSLQVTIYNNTYRKFFNVGLHKDNEKII